MSLLLVSFLAGALTVLAPCILPVLPVIIGGSVQGGRKRNPFLITGALALAIVVFTLLLKFSTALISIPPEVWAWISGGIIIFFGLVSLFPNAWTRLSEKLRFVSRSETLLAESAHISTWRGDVLIGLSLGPVFSSCSPTYFIILATVLPQNFSQGLIYLLAYAAGLSVVLLGISLLGQRLIQRIRWAANPDGWFKRSLGILFILVGIFIGTGFDKTIQTFLIERGYPLERAEQLLLEKSFGDDMPQVMLQEGEASSLKSLRYPVYKEIAQPSGFINSEPFALKDLVGKKVILLDIMTYSCINCLRTFPYLNAWYETYKDDGLEIIAIHTPEFAFEKNIENVREAMEREGIKFPVVLDNDYATWNAYGNRYWPRKYLIDIDGYIVYDHIGEGDYEKTEARIRDLLLEKQVRDAGETNVLPEEVSSRAATQTYDPGAKSPETYFGAWRNTTLGNGTPSLPGTQTFSLPTSIQKNRPYFSGEWMVAREYAEALSPETRLTFHYTASHVYLVAESPEPRRLEVRLDEAPLPKDLFGTDVFEENGRTYIEIDEERLYDVVNQKELEGHTLELLPEIGVRLYTFTFG